MKRLATHILVFAFLSGCAAAFGSGGGDSGERATLWSEGQTALWEGNFPTALERFTYLRATYPQTIEGRESLFYLGAVHLDPRNPSWDSKPAEQHLAEYLGLIGGEGARLYRYPEAQTLHEIARQLNLPPESRVEALQPGERVVRVREPVIVQARESRELSAEVARLREELAAARARNQQQEEELERIRRTLTAPRP